MTAAFMAISVPFPTHRKRPVVVNRPTKQGWQYKRLEYNMAQNAKKRLEKEA
jgi:hypothetical protein